MRRSHPDTARAGSRESFARSGSDGFRPHDERRAEARFGAAPDRCRASRRDCRRSHFRSCGIAPCTIATARAWPDRLRPLDALPAREPRTQGTTRTTAAITRVALRAAHERDERTRAHEQERTDPVHADDGRERREPRIGLRVAERQPREAGEKPAAPPFDEEPGGGHADQPAQGAVGRQPARDDIAQRRVIQRHDGGRAPNMRLSAIHTGASPITWTPV